MFGETQSRHIRDHRMRDLRVLRSIPEKQRCFLKSLQSKPKSCCHPQTKWKEGVRDNLKNSGSRLSFLLQVRDHEHKNYHKSTAHSEDSSNLWAVLPRFLLYSYSTFLLPINRKNKLGLLSGSITMSPPSTTCLSDRLAWQPWV